MVNLSEAGISWRVYQRLDAKRAAQVNDAHYTPVEERTGRQERILFQAAWESRKRENREQNLANATGRVHTSNGVTTFKNGVGHRASS